MTEVDASWVGWVPYLGGPSLVLRLPPTLPVNPYPQPVSESHPATPASFFPFLPPNLNLTPATPAGIRLAPQVLPLPRTHQVSVPCPPPPKLWLPQDAALAV